MAESAPVERVIDRRVAAHQCHAVREAAMREGYVGARSGAERRRNSGNDAPGDTGGGQGLELLAAAAEDVTVAALQASDPLARAAEADHELIDVRLLRLVAAFLADEHTLGVAARSLEDRIRHQPVIQDHVG